MRNFSYRKEQETRDIERTRMVSAHVIWNWIDTLAIDTMVFMTYDILDILNRHP